MRKLTYVLLAVLALAGCGGQDSPKASPKAAADGGDYSQGVKDYYGDGEAQREAEAGSIEDVESEYHQPPKPVSARRSPSPAPTSACGSASP